MAKGARAVDDAIRTLGDSSGIPAAALREAVTVLDGDAVAHHLFAVTSGLESVVVGEEEISGQVRPRTAAGADRRNDLIRPRTAFPTRHAHEP